jgi:hypothetical protein
MRRTLVLLAGLGLLSLTAGCNHTAGICDCEGPGNPCVYGGCGNGHGPGPIAPPIAAPYATLKPEPIKELPKVAPEKIGEPKPKDEE